tara:strand:- start:3334 stop:3936 length:603 start_codon:yes stop_codon:yes gene_type:complete
MYYYTHMAIHVEPEGGIPIPPPVKTRDLAGRASAAAETVKFLSEHGLEVKANGEDKDISAKLAMSYAADPEKTSKKATPTRTAALTPATLLLTDQILKNFGHSVVESATQVRHLVTNKLIEETENADAKVRIRALELLGKIADVGLFAERTEVTITHQSTDDLKDRLRSKLAKLVDPVEDAVVLGPSAIDLDKEFGLKDD